MTSDDPGIRIAELEVRVEMLRMALSTLLSWMGQSANSPLSRTEVAMLLRQVEEVE